MSFIIDKMIDDLLFDKEFIEEVHKNAKKLGVNWIKLLAVLVGRSHV